MPASRCCALRPVLGPLQRVGRPAPRSIACDRIVGAIMRRTEQQLKEPDHDNAAPIPRGSANASGNRPRRHRSRTGSRGTSSGTAGSRTTAAGPGMHRKPARSAHDLLLRQPVPAPPLARLCAVLGSLKVTLKLLMPSAPGKEVPLVFNVHTCLSRHAEYR